ncbi:Uncharacterized protein FWK35_00028919 [Aphis craccivora]|uniref:Uncharacterized protein n=1 Tax=Aphis craccivora TaxID=307492 RepID=A0A6G0YBS8_APHCR|nr:Uncharacterized protein FWK35_00028919 [Aphis craccivora]
MANETMVSCREPEAGDSKSEPDESSYMLRDKRSSPSSTIRGQYHQHPEYEHQHRTFDDSWAWYVVGGCAFANFLLPGMLRSFGPDVLDGFVEVHKLEFENRSVVGCRWIPATFHLTFFIAGSLSCLLCKLISYRAVTFWGGLLASAGMMSSSFANSILHLYISYGVMVGFGAGLCYSAGILIVNEYFDKHRGLANGLSLAGAAFGALAMPPYLEFLTISYGYRGGILIVSGMMLNTLACSLTYKPAVADGRSVQQDETACSSRPSASSLPTTSINARAVTTTAFRAATDLYYAAVVSSPSPPLLKPKTTTAEATTTDDEEDEDDDDDDDSSPNPKNTRWRRWLRRRRPRLSRPAAEFLAVSAVHAIGHLAYATAAPARGAALHLAAAEAAGRLIAPAASDALSPGGGSAASVYLYAAAVAVGGTVLLTGAAAAESNVDPFLQWSRPAQWSGSLVVAFGLAFGAAVGLEPLVAVHVLGRQWLAASCSATLLGKGAAQLAVDLFLQRPPPPPSAGLSTPVTISPYALYALGSCLVATAAAWTAAFLVKRHYAAKTGCSRYVRTS